MSQIFKIATFNVENLFTRPKLLNFDLKDNALADQILDKVSKLRDELTNSKYNAAKILGLYADVREFININEVRGKLFKRGKKMELGAKGKADWEGWIELKRDTFDYKAVDNTARVIKEVNADITCIIEVENRPTLTRFSHEKLPQKYPFSRVIDGNDDRGIDVGVLSKAPILRMISHVDDTGLNRKPIFSRDCLEVQIRIAEGLDLWFLINHLKSKGYGVKSKSDDKRKLQAERVAEILKSYDLEKDPVIVAGDFNDTPDSAALAPLLSVANLHDVLAGKDPSDSWTYYYRKIQQIDYLLVSKPLKEAMKASGVERRGIYKLTKYSKGKEKEFDTVTSSTSAASDHGAVWAEFEL